MSITCTSLLNSIKNIPDYNVYGCVTSLSGMLIECNGINNFVEIGTICEIAIKNDQKILTEVIAIHPNKILLTPFTSMTGITIGCKVTPALNKFCISPDISWKGRIINSLCQPLDGKGELKNGNVEYSRHNNPPPANKRNILNQPLDLGIRAINTFIPFMHGQRLGIFAGSGVGKSILLSMINKFSKTDIKIIALIGERGREVNEFIHEYVGKDGLENTIIVVATSDEAPIIKRNAAYAAITIAEYFRDHGLNVLFLMDSITRFAMAQRDIGLSINEHPTSKGYTSTVFSELSKILERIGPGEKNQGNISGLITVLVEGDDTNEPISDAVRGIIDGHIILDRKISERGRYPSINILSSISRTIHKCHNSDTLQLVNNAKNLLSRYEEMKDMIKLGAYKKGNDLETDKSIKAYEALEKFISQEIHEESNMEQDLSELHKIMTKINN